MNKGKKEVVAEVKKRLSGLGISEIDEIVIREILQSCDSNNEVDYALKIITGTSDFCNTDAQNTYTTYLSKQKSFEEDSSNEQIKKICLTGAIKKRPISSRSIVDITTDSENDDTDNNYFPFTKWVEDDQKSSYSGSISDVQLNGKTSSSMHKQVDSSDIEILEENNNDSNNNLGEQIQILQDSGYAMDTDFYELPGMSNFEKSEYSTHKDSDISNISKHPQRLKEEVQQICSLIPRLKFSTVYKVLHRNRHAKNRIELTLWDLLPEKRPVALLPFKRKNQDDICTVENKKLPQSIEINQPNKQKHNQKGKRFVAHQSNSMKDILFDEVQPQNQPPTIETLFNTMRQEHNFSMKDTISRQKGGKGKMENKKNKNFFPDQFPMFNKSNHGLIRPPKLIVGNATTQKNIPALMSMNPILMPPKLNYIPTKYSQDGEWNSWKQKNAHLQSANRKQNDNTIVRHPMGTTKDTSYGVRQNNNPQFEKNKNQNKHPCNKISKRNIALFSLKYNESTDNIEVLDSYNEVRKTSKLEKQNGNSQVPNPNFNKFYTDEAAINLDIFLDHPDSVTMINNIEGIQDPEILEVKEQKQDKKVPNKEKENFIFLPLDDLNDAAAVNTLDAADNFQIISYDGSERELEVVPIDNLLIPIPGPSGIQNADKNKTNKINLTFEDDNMAIPGPSGIQNADKNKTGKRNLIFEDDDMAIPGPSGIKNIGNSSNRMGKQTSRVKSAPPYTNISDVQDMDYIIDDEIEEIEEKVELSPKVFKVYYKLISMFPHVNSRYIRKICADMYIEEEEDEVTNLYSLTEHLLTFGHEHPQVVKISEDSMYSMDEQYANLLGIFPDADPTYLRTIAEQIYNDPDKIKEFVQTKLELKDYPTREQFLAKQKITEQQKQYTTDFNIKHFLQIFPDPFAHFENPERICAFDPIAFEFLKNQFNKLKISTITDIYKQYNYNLTLTMACIEHRPSDMKTKRASTPPYLTENIPLLQELAFIQHKNELRHYIQDLKRKEEEEYNNLKASGGLLECQCCFDSECMPLKCETCENGHVFCYTCILKGTESKLGDGQARVPCFMNCNSEFSLSVLQKVLPPTQFSILLRKRQEAEIMAAGLEGLVSCPYCHFASIPAPEDKVFKCFNPECMKESCRFCKKPNHIPFKCDEIDGSKQRHYLEEKMTEAFIRKCHSCGKPFFKEQGCNKISCSCCGAQMCYVCDKPVTGYGHFNGQGSRRLDLCPLWSDDPVVSAQAVRRVAEATLKEIKEKNPDIELDAGNLLPTVPNETAGPHRDIPNANVLPEHVNRIVRNEP